MSLIQSVVPQKTRLAIKEALGLQRVSDRLGEIATAIPAVEARLARVEEFVARPASDPRKEFSAGFWYDRNLTEPTVALALRDLSRPGDILFDVGANRGSLSILMSRLAGPKGVVCSFEASRRIVDKCQYNLVVNGCHNTQLFHRAVFRHSGEVVKIYHGSHLNDTVVHSQANAQNYHEVETISLDDFVDHFDLHPKLIKMDIEGAEYDALQGARRMIANDRPIIILEQQPDDSRCLEFLLGQDYAAIDLAVYAPINSAADYPPGVGLANVLFIDRAQLERTPYRLPLKRTLVRTLDRADFRRSENGSVELLNPLEFESGRYLFRMEFSAQGTSNEALAGVEADGAVAFQYHTHSSFLANSYRDWTVDLPRTQSINLFFRFLRETADPTFDLRGAEVYRIDSLSSLSGLRIE